MTNFKKALIRIMISVITIVPIEANNATNTNNTRDLLCDSEDLSDRYYGLLAKGIVDKFRYCDMSIDTTKEVLKQISKYSHVKGVCFEDVLAIICRESSWRSKVKNPNSSAIGLMQLIKGTAISMGYSYDSLKDPFVNIKAGIDYLYYAAKIYNGEKLVVSYSSYVEANFHKDGNYHPFIESHNKYRYFIFNLIRENMKKVMIHSWVGSEDPVNKAFMRNNSSHDKSEVLTKAARFIEEHGTIFKIVDNGIPSDDKITIQKGDEDIAALSIEYTEAYKEFSKEIGNELLVFGSYPKHSMEEVSRQEVLRNLEISKLRDIKNQFLKLKDQINSELKHSFKYFNEKGEFVYANHAKRYDSLDSFMDNSYKKKGRNPVIEFNSYEDIDEKTKIFLIGNLLPRKQRKVIGKLDQMAVIADAVDAQFRFGRDVAFAINMAIKTLLDMKVNQLNFNESAFISRDNMFHSIKFDDSCFVVSYKEKGELYRESEEYIRKVAEKNKKVKSEYEPKDEIANKVFNYIEDKYYDKEQKKRKYYVNPALFDLDDPDSGKLLEEHIAPIVSVRTTNTIEDIFGYQAMKTKAKASRYEKKSAKRAVVLL